MAARRASARDRLEGAIARAIALLDVLDGDPDLDAQCEDEGHDSDSEPVVHHAVPTYADDGHDQRRIVKSHWAGQTFYTDVS